MKRSNISGLSLSVVLMASLATACSNPNGMAAESPHFAFADLAAAPGQKKALVSTPPPYVLTFKAGDEIPFHFVLESRIVSLEVPPLKFVAKKDFWILIRPDGPPLASLDGKDFTTQAQNSFMFGIAATKDEAPSVRAKIRYRAD